MALDEDALLAEQVACYRARAPEYDRVYAERADLRELVAVVDGLPIAGDVLTGELGTLGWSADIERRGEFIVGIARPRAEPAD